MGTKIGDLANSYHTAFNNQLNAKKAYIDAYITGINARNAVNQEARTKDQYWNYTQPLGQSNLANIQAKNNIETGILTNQDYINNIQGYSLDNAAKQFKLGRADMDNLANYIETQKQNSTTGLNNSKIAASGSAEALSVLPMSQELSRKALVAALGRQPTELEFAQLTAEQNLANAKNPQNVTTTDGTPTSIMLQKGGKTPTGMFGTDGRLNFTGTTTTPASGLPSNPSNAQKNSQSQTASGYTNKYYEDTDATLTKLDAEIDKQKRLSDLAQQYGKTSDYIDAQYNLNVAKKARSGLTGNSIYNRVNRFALNPFDALFSNKSKADYDYEQAISNSNNR